MPAENPESRRATPKTYDEMVGLMAEMFEWLAELRQEDPEHYRRVMDEEAETFDWMRGLVRRHPQILGDLEARLELNELMEDDRFRESLEQMRRGERGEWPERWVSAAPGKDWDPEG